MYIHKLYNTTFLLFLIYIQQIIKVIASNYFKNIDCQYCVVKLFSHCWLLTCAIDFPLWITFLCHRHLVCEYLPCVTSSLDSAPPDHQRAPAVEFCTPSSTTLISCLNSLKSTWTSKTTSWLSLYLFASSSFCLCLALVCLDVDIWHFVGFFWIVSLDMFIGVTDHSDNDPACLL